jgi:hypothetical protein
MRKPWYQDKPRALGVGTLTCRRVGSEIDQIMIVMLDMTSVCDLQALWRDMRKAGDSRGARRKGGCESLKFGDFMLRESQEVLPTSRGHVRAEEARTGWPAMGRIPQKGRC